jgi:hypothetical protein
MTGGGLDRRGRQISPAHHVADLVLLDRIRGLVERQSRPGYGPQRCVGADDQPLGVGRGGENRPQHLLGERPERGDGDLFGIVLPFVQHRLDTAGQHFADGVYGGVDGVGRTEVQHEHVLRTRRRDDPRHEVRRLPAIGHFERLEVADRQPDDLHQHRLRRQSAADRFQRDPCIAGRGIPAGSEHSAGEGLVRHGLAVD